MAPELISIERSIPLSRSLNHPIFSFYVFTVLKHAFRIFWSRMVEIHAQLVALRARDFEARASSFITKHIENRIRISRSGFLW